MSENNFSKFERAIVTFAPGVSMDCYETPNGEYRIGITGASTVLGFSKEWLGRVATRKGKALKTLEGLGFSWLPQEGRVINDTSSQRVVTISVDDFSLLITYAISLKKKEAFVLQTALNKISVTDFIRDALGKRQLTMAEKKASFYERYANMINWLENDRADWQLIEEQEEFTGLNAYRPPIDDED